MAKVECATLWEMNVVDPDSVSTARLAGPPKELLASTTFLLKRLGHAAKERTF
jgi:hypothetical protein